MSGTEVTARDTETGETEKQTIVDDYIVITDGNCFVSNVQMHENGTTVVTIKRERLAAQLLEKEA